MHVGDEKIEGIRFHLTILEMLSPLQNLKFPLFSAIQKAKMEGISNFGKDLAFLILRLKIEYL